METHHAIKKQAHKITADMTHKIRKMFSCVCHSMELACNALMQRNNNAAVQVFVNAEDLSAKNDEINYEGMDIITRHKPCGKDLDDLLILMRLGSLLDSISINSVSMTKHVLRINNAAEIRETRLLEPAFMAILRHISTVSNAFSTCNYDKLKQFKKSTRERDTSIKALTTRLAKVFQNDGGNIATLAELILLSRSIEHVWFAIGKIESEILEMEI